MPDISRISIDIETLNKKNEENVYKFINRGEEAYIEQVREIANQVSIYNKKIVLVSGPSSAGKTTSSFKLKQELQKLGIHSYVLNMDNFFKDLDTVPLREDGKPDMEGIVALDVEGIHKCIEEILTKNRTKIPSFDFKTHKRKKEWKKCVLKNKEIIIIEGIHALNPLVYDKLDLEKIYKVYVHCNTNFIFDNKVLLLARELRFLRRIVRDELFRHTLIQKTIELWDSVCVGEDQNIRPFKIKANYWLNTTHYYEPFLYKELLLPKFKDLKENIKVKDFLEKFKPMSTISRNFVPKNSLVREFIGEDK